MKLMTINGQKATISYDKDIDMFRGEFVGLNGEADFYAKNMNQLHEEGMVSLNVFLDMCKENGIEPFKNVSGKFRHAD